MREAARRGYRVLYVDPLGLRRPTLTRKDVAKLRRRLSQLRAPVAAVEEGILRLAPIGVPLQDTRLGIRLNTRLLGLHIRRALRGLGARRILLWVYPPQLITLRSVLTCELVIYHRTDDYVSLPGMNGEFLRKCEIRAVREADLCIAPARRYLDGPLRSARNALWVPNAVDHRMFELSRIGDDPLPDVSRPRLLMIGTFDEWVDLDLLRAVMSARPTWNLVLAGDPKTSLERLLELENVRFLGRVPYEELATLISSCDVGLIPFRIGPVAADATPSKLYQYLAGGLPVLCTPFVDRELFDGQVSIAGDSPDEFAGAVEDLLRADSAAARDKRRSYVLEHSWSARFDAIETELLRLSHRRAG
jgi:glycosyltransferase involved in cell wall biosynthesis